MAGWPAAVTAVLPVIQVPGGSPLIVPGCRIRWPPCTSPTPFQVTALSARVVCAGEIRCGRTKIGHRIWIATNTASVMAMAAIVRRISRPAVTPSAKAKAAYPIGAIPVVPNNGGVNRLMLSEFWLAWPAARYSGLAHQPTMRLSSPAAAIEASPTRPSFTAIQRRRVMRLVPGQPERAGLELAG